MASIRAPRMPSQHSPVSATAKLRRDRLLAHSFRSLIKSPALRSKTLHASERAPLAIVHASPLTHAIAASGRNAVVLITVTATDADTVFPDFAVSAAIRNVSSPGYSLCCSPNSQSSGRSLCCRPKLFCFFPGRSLGCRPQSPSHGRSLGC